MNPPPPPGAINTAAYELYALNTEKISVEELLAKTYEERTTLLADQAYWTLLASRTNNLEDITEDELDASGARIFKINVSDTDSTGWGDCVRIYELELYAYKEAAKSELLTGKAQVLALPPLPLRRMRARSRPLTRTTEPSGAP